MNIKVLSATVILSGGTDTILVEVDLPCSFVKEAVPSQPRASFRLDATYDTGVEYCKKYLGVTPQVIDTR